MIPRIPEAEVMDGAAGAAEYDSMDHAAVNRAFAADFRAAWNGRSPILDIGTGTAQIPIEFCRQSPEGEIVAIDLSREMLKLARRNVENAGFQDRIEVELADGQFILYGDGHFPAVMSNSIIHHIPEPAECLKEIVRVTAADGTIFVRDLLRPETSEELNRLVELHAAGATPAQRQLFADSLHAAMTVQEVREIVAGLGCDPNGVTQTSDRHWTWVRSGSTL